MINPLNSSIDRLKFYQQQYNIDNELIVSYINDMDTMEFLSMEWSEAEINTNIDYWVCETVCIPMDVLDQDFDKHIKTNRG